MHGHRPRKRFGQNFLADLHYVARIVAAVDPQRGDNVVEIGPGLGALTGELIARAGTIAAVEIDRDLAARLSDRFASAQLRLFEADALAFDFAPLGPRLRVVGNLPYNISSPLLFHLASFDAQLRDVHVMLQREVADRVLAAPGGGDYGPLAVMLGLFADRSRVLSLPPGAFRPAPQVHSAVVRLAFRPPPVPVARFDAVDRLVRTAFQQRRKTLANALRPLTAAREAGGAAPLDLAAVLHGAGIDPMRRPETVTPEEFVHLADTLIPLSVL